MIEPPNDPDEPAPSEFDAEGPLPPAPRSRLRAAVALTLVASIVVVGGVGTILVRSGDNAATGGATDDGPLPSPLGPIRLAVVDVKGGLRTMDADGGSVVELGAAGVAYQFPAWSPDGARIAVIGEEAGSGMIHVVDAGTAGAAPTGGEPALAYESRDRHPFYLSWSPDSARITFLTNEANDLALRVAPAAGGADDTILRRGSPLYWDWVDAGRLMVHVGSARPDAFLGEIGLDAESDASGDIAPGFFRPPVIGRDGRYRAYAMAPEAGGAIVVERLDGSGRHEIAATGSVAIGLDPSGRRLAWTASGATTEDPPALPIGPLHVADAETGVDRVVLDRPTLAFYWSPDGRMLAAIELLAGGDPEVDVASAGFRVGGMASAGLRMGGMGRTAAVEPPGIAVGLTFVDVGGDAPRILSEQVVRISDLYAFQILPYFDQYALSHRTWSADGKAIALPLVDEAGRSRVMAIAPDGSAPRPVADGAIGFWSP